MTASFAPSRMIEPLPNCFSIWPTAISMAFKRSRSLRSSTGGITLLVKVNCLAGPDRLARFASWDVAQSAARTRLWSSARLMSITFPRALTGKVTRGAVVMEWVNDRIVPWRKSSEKRGLLAVSTCITRLTDTCHFRLMSVSVAVPAMASRMTLSRKCHRRSVTCSRESPWVPSRGATGAGACRLRAASRRLVRTSIFSCRLPIAARRTV